ncbi:MAG: DUF4868 domain-containing protein [Candidatus Nomurabacteria bacterium]|nr:MAG: DUF4868 domain-containing protein [Candidatus Nomurabacteria bacterium]
MEDTDTQQSLKSNKEKETKAGGEETDVFAWANNLVQIKEELTIELFLFSKNYVVYRAQVSKSLHRNLEAILIDNLLEAVLDGADSGLVVRNFEDAEEEKNVLQRTRLNKVENAHMVLNWLKTQEHEIEPFVEEEHDFKRVKGVVARCSHKELPTPFYIIKALPQSQIMKGSAGWMLRGGKFVPFDAEGALRIPADNQLLVLESDIYVFNQSKLASLFGYDAKKYTIAEQKLKLIAEHFKLSIDTDQTIEQMVKGKKNLVNKLQKLDPTKVTQEKLVQQAEELDLPLMVDNSGAIIIMDSKDLNVFVNLLNDDYVESPVTNERYEITGKKPLKPPEGEEILKTLPPDALAK